MIYWATVSVPIYLPTSGVVFVYLLLGLATLLFLALRPKSGYRILTKRDSPLVGLIWTLVIMISWPAGWVIYGRTVIRRRRGVI